MAPIPQPEAPSIGRTNFNESPFLIIWETTQACDLACLHCRASARPMRDPGELDTATAMKLMDTARSFGQPLFVLTGGDPLKREDTVELVEYGTSIGLRVAMTPSGTPLMTPAILGMLQRAGLARLAVSLDGSSAAIHDHFRGVSGSFDWTVQMLGAAQALGLSTQINTTISRHNLHDIEPIVDLMGTLGIALWSVFFIVPTGRARLTDMVTAEEIERVFHRLYDLSKTAAFDVKTTAAPHYRRVMLQRQVAERRSGAPAPGPVEAGLGFTLGDHIRRARGVNDGNGFVFISHRGDIYPSGFLPLSAGNIRTHDLVDVYRNSPLFRDLRDIGKLEGKCGVCEFRTVCGGSRARAYATTGNYVASDPYCSYIPARAR